MSLPDLIAFSPQPTLAASKMTTTGPQLISEPLEPQPGAFNASVMARGEPGLPCGFTWRNQKMILFEVLEHWKESGPCRHSSSERYVRKHWYKVRTGNHQIATLYFDRQTRSTQQKNGAGGSTLWKTFTTHQVDRSAPSGLPILTTFGKQGATVSILSPRLFTYVLRIF